MPSFSKRPPPPHKCIASTCILTLLLLLAVFSIAVQARSNQTDNERVDDHIGPSWRGNPQVVLDGTGTVHAFWEDHRQWPQKGIYGNIRAESWGAETRLFSGNAVALGPCAIDTVGTLYFTYRDSNGVPRFQKRAANGDWDTPEMIPNNRLPIDLAVTGNGNVYLLFAPDVNGRVYALTRSADGTWLGQERVNPANNALLGISPRLTWDNDGTLYAIWGHWYDEAEESQIYLNQRATTGEWGTSQRVDSVPSEYAVIGMDVSASAGNVHILWTSCDASNACKLFYNQCNSQDCPENKEIHTTTDNTTLNYPRLVMDEAGNAYGLLSSYLIDSGVQKIYLARRSINGVWSELVELDSFESSTSQYD